MLKKIGYTISPSVGGTSTFFEILRKSLQKYGWEVYGFCTKPIVDFDPSVINDFLRIHNGIIVDGDTPAKKSAALVELCEKLGLFAVIVTDDRIGTASIPHFPDHIRIIIRSNGIKSIGYRLDTYYHNFVDAFIATSPRQKKDLEEKFHIEREKMWLIPHGVEDFLDDVDLKYKKENENLMRLAYVGRLAARGKGVLLLPKIAKTLVIRGKNILLNIFGAGGDEEKLRAQIKKDHLNSYFVFHGKKNRVELFKLLFQCDILLLPSYYEGFGFSLIEAMSLGVIPVASRIRDVTDWIIKDGFSGFLCEIGNIGEFAAKICLLSENTRLVREMGKNARQEYLDRFTEFHMAAEYNEMLIALEQKPIIKKGRGLDQFNFALCRTPYFRRYVPTGIINAYTKWFYRK